MIHAYKKVGHPTDRKHAEAVDHPAAVRDEHQRTIPDRNIRKLVLLKFVLVFLGLWYYIFDSDWLPQKHIKNKGRNAQLLEKAPDCVPPPPPFILEDTRVTNHPAVVAAIAHIDKELKQHAAEHEDTLSLSIVHASKGQIYSFHHGRIRLNESAEEAPAIVDGDSIYRIASVTKTFVLLEALVLSARSRIMKYTPELTLDTRLQLILPSFKLPPGYENEAGDITLAHLGSHRAGIARDIGDMQIDSLEDIVYPPPANFSDSPLDLFPANNDQKSILNLTAHTDLIWKVGQTPSYSNTGISLLAFGLEEYRTKLYQLDTTFNFSDIVAHDVFEPLNMTKSFMGPIPTELQKHITIPKPPNFVDVLFAKGVDPAGGMFSSTNDLSTFLHRVLLSNKPELITPAQRLTWLKPVHVMTDGATSVGIPWEIFRVQLPDQSIYNVYTKGGALPFHYSEISVLPEFGYGIVDLTAIGSSFDDIKKGVNYTQVAELQKRFHNVLAPAFQTAYNDLLKEEYVGTYSSSKGKAKIVFRNGLLILESFTVGDVDVLLKFDQILWMEVGQRPRDYDQGARLEGTGFEGIFRAGHLKGCGWFGYDAVTTKSGWGFDKIVIKKGRDGTKTLIYEPMRVELEKEASKS